MSRAHLALGRSRKAKHLKIRTLLGLTIIGSAIYAHKRHGGVDLQRVERRQATSSQHVIGLLISKREPHIIRNTGRRDLVTVNIYAPPAYRADGEPLA